MTDCDNDALAQCLNEADNEFYDCERGCRSDYPDDAGSYEQCRNQCRDFNFGVKQECYKLYCETRFDKIFKKRHT